MCAHCPRLSLHWLAIGGDVAMYLDDCESDLVNIGMTYGMRVKRCSVSVFSRAEEAGSGVRTEWW